MATQTGSAWAGTTFSLPLVSVIIVNFNYGRFVREAFESVKAQSYPFVECFVVDDASTDGSATALAEIGAQGATVIKHETNKGQLAAFITGFEASSGEFVVFLDADDCLTPDFVAIHVFTHLSSRICVGFTSSDMFHVDAQPIRHEHLEPDQRLYGVGPRA